MLAFVASAWVVLAIAIATAPETVRAICAKEGPCEVVSHVVLGVAAVGFASAYVRARLPVRAWALGLVALACVVVLGEELDWGGTGNLHNAAGGHSYVVFALAAPLLAAVALGRGAWAHRWQARLGPWAPRSSDGVAGLVVLAVALVVAIAAPGWDAVVDEVAELLGYCVIAAIAARGHAFASGFSSSTYS